jgi:hypothetical protein
MSEVSDGRDRELEHCYAEIDSLREVAGNEARAAIRALEESGRLRKQRDEMLALLREISTWLGEDENSDATLRRVEALVDRIDGEAKP